MDIDEVTSKGLPRKMGFEERRRAAICAACPLFDDGCTLLKKCDRKRLTAILWQRPNVNGCKRGKWAQPCVESGFHLPSVETVVYSIPPNQHRRERVTKMLNGFGFTNWRFHTARAKRPDEWYGHAQWEGYANLLDSLKTPFLLLEDDIAVRDFRPWVNAPEGSQILYLGSGRGSTDRWQCTSTPNAALGYEPVDDQWFRAYGIFYIHAVLYICENAKSELVSIMRSHQPRSVDQTMAEHQGKWKVMCAYFPWWYQNDGHNERSTYEYAPGTHIPRAPGERLAELRQAIRRHGAKRV